MMDKRAQKEFVAVWPVRRVRHIPLPALAGRISLGRHLFPVALAGTGLILLVLLFAPWVWPVSPLETDYSAVLQPPSREYWFGSDFLGRDVFSRVLWGGRVSLSVAFLGILFTLLGGGMLGLIAGYWGGLVDEVIMRMVDVWLAFPPLLILLSISALLGPGLDRIVFALAISAIPRCSRLVRASVMALKQRDFVDASRALGASGAQILWAHILPHTAPVMILFAVIQMSAFLLSAAGLSFFGLGAQPPVPEWGAMLNEGRSFFREAWWLLAFPGIALFTASFWINLLGEGLREVWDR